MIKVTSIRRCHIADYDEVYLIIRSTASLERSGSSLLSKATQLADLSPSKSLFYDYLDWQKQGIWNAETFEKQYKPRFFAEIQNNPVALSLLSDLKDKDAAGKRIALLCFCQDENLCHRKIIGEILRDNGCNVLFDNNMK